MYNYIEKTARVVFGPDLVVLDPHENFNVLSLSGKREGRDRGGEGRVSIYCYFQLVNQRRRMP